MYCLPFLLSILIAYNYCNLLFVLFFFIFPPFEEDAAQHVVVKVLMKILGVSHCVEKGLPVLLKNLQFQFFFSFFFFFLALFPADQ